MGRTTEHQYDDFGNLTGVTLPDGAATQYRYDAGNRLTEIIDANGHREQLAYNESDQLVQRTNALGLSTHYRYDDLGRVIEIQQPEAGTNIHMAYNGRDQLTERRFKGTVERSSYDARGNLTQIDSPTSQESTNRTPIGVRFERALHSEVEARLEGEVKGINGVRVNDPVPLFNMKSLPDVVQSRSGAKEKQCRF